MDRRTEETGEDGAVAVVVAVLAVVLLGFAALAVDVGNLLWERSMQQNSADAAALAAAQELATGSTDDAGAGATAEDYADRNNPRGSHLDDFAHDAGRQEVSVVAGTGSEAVAGDLSTWFASVIGTDSTRATASAVARYGGDGATLPLTISTCDLAGVVDDDPNDDEGEQGDDSNGDDSNGDEDEVDEPTVLTPEQVEAVVEKLPEWNDNGGPHDSGKQRITLHDPKDDDDCTISPGFSAAGDDKMAGGFGWLDLETNDDCRVNIRDADPFGDDGSGDYASVWAPSEGGTSPKGLDCLEEAFNSGEPVPVPIFIDVNGAPAKEYRLIAPASFLITGYRIPGSGGGNKIGELEKPCKGKEWCIEGHFYKNVEGGGPVWGTESFGATTVELIE